MPATNRYEAKHAAGGGVVAGIVGGLVSYAVMLIAAVAKGQPIWPNIKGAAYPFIGQTAMQPGFDAGPVLLGALIHFAISIAWGVGFALLFYGASRGATVALGAVWGVVCWLVMYYVVLPVVGMSFAAEHTPVAAAAINHIVFGVAVAIGFLPYQRTKRVVRPRVDRGVPIMP